jgi:Ca2+-binding RTX toxin-like protein
MSSRNERRQWGGSLEELETRRLLSVTVISGVLTVNNQGSPAARVILVDVDSSGSTPQYRVTDNGKVHEFPETGIDSVYILGGPTSNSIEVDATFPNATSHNGLNGGPGPDTLVGSPGGHDVIFGGGGADSITSRGVDDVVNGNAGPDTIIGGPGNDTILGDKGRDSITLTSGNNMAFGNQGNDTLIAGTGNDTIYGKGGADLIEGGEGNDQLNGSAGKDTIIGGTGSSTLNGGIGRDVLAAAGADLLSTGAALPTAAGLDSLSGGIGADTLLSLSATDTLSGGTGANEFDAPSGATLTDFNAAQGDFEPSQNVFTGTAAQQTTITLSININGSPATIPVGAGSFPGGTSIAQVTSVNANIATVLFQSASATTVNLGQFFTQWGIAFNSRGIGQYINGPSGALSMTVNGVANTSFRTYAVQNGDNIVINFG